MGRREQIEKLRWRKEALIQESHLNRLALSAQWQELQVATAWMNEAARIGRRVRPWLVLLVPLAAGLTVAGPRRAGGWISRLFSLAKWVRPALALWKGFEAGSAKAHEERPGRFT